MRGATQCARRLKRLLRTLKSSLGRVPRPSVGDPVTQMVLGILSRDMPESKAREVLDRVHRYVVDYNELRVTSPRELAEHIGEYPDCWTKCEDVSRALNSLFAIRHDIVFDQISDQPRKEVRQYLERIEGLEAYTRARIRLQGLQQHAVPLDTAMWAYARKHEIVDHKCSLDDAQNFLEREIEPEQALDCVALLKKQAWSEMGPAVRRGDIEPIRSIPPDRSSRNMLQPIVRGRAEEAVAGAASNEPGEKVASDAAEPQAPADRGASRRRARTAGRKPLKARAARSKRTSAASCKTARKTTGKSAANRRARSTRKLPRRGRRRAKSA